MAFWICYTSSALPCTFFDVHWDWLVENSTIYWQTKVQLIWKKSRKFFHFLHQKSSFASTSLHCLSTYPSHFQHRWTLMASASHRRPFGCVQSKTFTHGTHTDTDTRRFLALSPLMAAAASRTKHVFGERSNNDKRSTCPDTMVAS